MPLGKPFSLVTSPSWQAYRTNWRSYTVRCVNSTSLLMQTVRQKSIRFYLAEMFLGAALAWVLYDIVLTFPQEVCAPMCLSWKRIPTNIVFKYNSSRSSGGINDSLNWYHPLLMPSPPLVAIRGKIQLAKFFYLISRYYSVAILGCVSFPY